MPHGCCTLFPLFHLAECKRFVLASQRHTCTYSPNRQRTVPVLDIKSTAHCTQMNATHHMPHKCTHTCLTSGEDALRCSGVPYTIVRPAGLKNTPPQQDEIVAGEQAFGSIVHFQCWKNKSRLNSVQCARASLLALCLLHCALDDLYLCSSPD